ncbi:hypothetical protein ACODHD_05825 [Vagococcus fluvialis]
MIKEMIKKDTILPSLETAVDNLEEQINELRAVQKNSQSYFRSKSGSGI